MINSSSIFVVTGEASGDKHGAHLVKNILQERPEVNFFAMGSKHLAEAGAEIIVDSNDLGIVGFFEVLVKLKQVRQAFKAIKQAILNQKPSLVILIDYPGFNLRLAKAIKKNNRDIKIIYYISPQIWAWRYKRIYLIKKVVDLMAVIFPFEVKIYKKENIPVKFVGHPLVGKVKTNSTFDKKTFFGLQEESKIIGLMPGSRHNEIKHLLPVMIKTAQLLQDKNPNTMEFLLPLAPNFEEKDLLPFLNNTKLNLKIIKENHYDAIAACDVIIVTSGTATLEVTLLAKPMVVVYKSSSLSYALAKFLVKIPYVSLCNIIANKSIVKEFLQEKATSDNIVAEVNHILTDANYRQEMISNLREVSLQLEQHNAVESLTGVIKNYV